MGARFCGRSQGSSGSWAGKRICPTWPHFLGMRKHTHLGLSGGVLSFRFFGRSDARWDWDSGAWEVPTDPFPTGNDHPGGRFFLTLQRTVSKSVSCKPCKPLMLLYPIAEGVDVDLCVGPLFSVAPPGKAPCAIFKVTLASAGGHVCCFHVLAIVNNSTMNRRMPISFPDMISFPLDK